MRVARGEDREGRRQREFQQGLVRHGEDLGFYCERDGKPGKVWSKEVTGLGSCWVLQGIRGEGYRNRPGNRGIMVAWTRLEAMGGLRSGGRARESCQGIGCRRSRKRCAADSPIF